MSEDLKHKRILVTGASSGIGRAVARMANARGAECVLVARSAEALAETKAQCADPARCQVVVQDLAKVEAIGDWVRELVKRTGPFDGLVHAAGVGPATPIAYQDLDEVRNVMAINCLAFVELVRAFSVDDAYGLSASFVDIASVAAFGGYALTLYSASKGAVCACVKSLAMELVDKGLRVNSVCPANVRTPMFYAGSGSMHEGADLDALVKAHQPLGLIEVEDVAKTVCFLLSDAARKITGTNVILDAGCLAR